MIRNSNSSEIPIRANQASSKFRRALYSALIVVAGILFTGAHAPHIVDDVLEGHGPLALVTGALFPFLLALVTVAAGYSLWKSDLRASDLRRVTVWFLLGVGSLTLISAVIMTYVVLEGGRVNHLSYIQLNFATTGGIGGILVGWYDAQNKRRAEQLRVFRKVVEHGGHAVCLTDPEGTIEYVNPQFENQTGYTRQEVVGRNPRILKSGRLDDQFYEQMWETIQSGDVWEGEIVNKRKDGTEFHIEQTIAPVLREDGEIDRFVGINNDITDLKKREHDLEILNQVVRHDIRNDLQVITARVEILRDHIDQEGEQHLQEIHQAAEEAVELTKTARKLADSMMEDHDALKPISLSSHLRSQIEAFDDQYDEAEIKVDQDLPDVRVHADEMLEAVFRNLMQNAIVHTHKDHPEVTISVEVEDEMVYVSVADNGPGVPDAQKEDIFGKGEKGLDSPGTGLGLYLVKTLVEEYGGDVWIEDNEPGGSVFVVELPLAKSEASESSEETTGSWSSEGTVIQGESPQL